MRERDIYLLLERVVGRGPFPDAYIDYVATYSSEATAKKEAKRLKPRRPRNDFLVTRIDFLDEEDDE